MSLSVKLFVYAVNTSKFYRVLYEFYGAHVKLNLALGSFDFLGVR